jgi:hypothetical protein
MSFCAPSQEKKRPLTSLRVPVFTIASFHSFLLSLFLSFAPLAPSQPLCSTFFASLSGIAKSDPHSFEKQEALRARMASEASFNPNPNPNPNPSYNAHSRALTTTDDEEASLSPFTAAAAGRRSLSGEEGESTTLLASLPGDVAAQWARYQRDIQTDSWPESESEDNSSSGDGSSRRDLGNLNSEEKAPTGAAAVETPPPVKPAPPRVLYAVLARESALGQVVVDAVRKQGEEIFDYF